MKAGKASVKKAARKARAMPFLPEARKAKVTERLWEWRLRVEQAGPAAVYRALSAVALWPLVQAAQSMGMLSVALALGNVVAWRGR
jgi:hypothetical protein